MLDGVGRAPQPSRAWRVITPAHLCSIEEIAKRLMVETGIDLLLRLFDAFGVDQLHRTLRRRDTAVDRIVVLRIFRRERASVIIGRTRCRRAAEKKLMGGETRALIGLEHVV